jgi:hypothetical protein
MRIIIVTILLFSIGNSEPVVKINKNVLEFSQNYGKGIYRTGLKNENQPSWWQLESKSDFPKGLQKDDEESRSDVYNSWKETKDDEYEIVWDNPDKSLLGYFPKNADINYDTNRHLTSLIYPYNDSILMSHLRLGKINKISEEQLVKQARDKAHEFLACFQSAIEDNGANLTYLDDKVIKTEVTFRRIFRNGIVDSKVSYVSMVMNSLGIVEEIKIKWPSSTVLEYQANYNLTHKVVL